MCTWSFVWHYFYFSSLTVEQRSLQHVRNTTLRNLSLPPAVQRSRRENKPDRQDQARQAGGWAWLGVGHIPWWCGLLTENPGPGFYEVFTFFFDVWTPPPTNVAGLFISVGCIICWYFFSVNCRSAKYAPYDAFTCYGVLMFTRCSCKCCGHYLSISFYIYCYLRHCSKG